jgi:hypothetical protein
LGQEKDDRGIGERLERERSEKGRPADRIRLRVAEGRRSGGWRSRTQRRRLPERERARRGISSPPIERWNSRPGKRRGKQGFLSLVNNQMAMMGFPGSNGPWFIRPGKTRRSRGETLHPRVRNGRYSVLKEIKRQVVNNLLCVRVHC